MLSHPCQQEFHRRCIHQHMLAQESPGQRLGGIACALSHFALWAWPPLQIGARGSFNPWSWPTTAIRCCCHRGIPILTLCFVGGKGRAHFAAWNLLPVWVKSHSQYLYTIVHILIIIVHLYVMHLIIYL